MTINSILTSELDELETSFSIKNVVDTNDKMNDQVGVDFKMVTFSLAGKGYAIDIMYVKEIAKAGNFTYVPNAMSFVIGVYNLRGDIIPVLDMRIFFNLSTSFENTRELENLLILNVDGQTFGIVVDKIDKVVGVHKKAVQPPHPMFVDIKVEYISGVVEHAGALYILLAIEKIFSKTSKDNAESATSTGADNEAINGGNANTSYKEVNSSVEMTEVNEEKKSHSIVDEEDIYKKVASALETLQGFYASDINKEWIISRLTKWSEDHDNNIGLVTAEDAVEFLKPFHSAYTNEWWSKEYANSIIKALPETHDKNIVAWCLGCGSGIEAYCLACVLKERYPEANVKVYAQDSDLLAISNASILKVPKDSAFDWFVKYLSKNVAGEFVFNKDIKESLFFEYHDCRHSSMTPKANIIFARDLLSVVDAESVKSIIVEFEEKLKDDGIIFIGDNERLPNSLGFVEKTVGNVTVYNKE